MTPPAKLPPGNVTADVDDAELRVTLRGQIDLARRTQLTQLARQLSRYDGRVVVDLAEVTFGDGSLAGFLAEMLSRESNRVETPTRLSREFLKLYGLDHGGAGGCQPPVARRNLASRLPTSLD